MNSKTFEHLHPTMIYPLHQTLRKADTYAVILDVARHRKSEKVIGYRAEFISLTNLDPKEGTLFTADLPNWKPDTLPTGAGSKAVVSDALTILEQDKLKLTEEKAALEEQLEAARDTRNRAIDTATEASSHAAQLQSQVVELENQVKVLSGGLDRRDAIIGKLREYITELEGQRYVDPSVPLCKKYQVERDLQKEMLEKMEREGWTAEHMQFTETGSLHAVYSRFVSPPPAPQPEHTTHQDEPVNPAYTILGIDPINPVVDPTPAEIALQEAELIEARADAAEKTSPLPRFTRQGFMKDAWEASMNAAAQVVQNRNPAYDAIFNRPNALPAVAVRPS